MRTSIDYARDYLDVEKTSVNGKRPFASLADVIRAAQVEAYAEGKQDGMSKFLEIASTRVTRHVSPEMLTEDPHDNMVFSLRAQHQT